MNLILERQSSTGFNYVSENNGSEY